MTKNQIGHFEILRREANEVKDCFTRYSFQTIAIASAGLGLILRFQIEQPFVGAAGAFIVGLVVIVARLGIYKYGTANRIHGYELYYNRMAHHEVSSLSGGWQPYMRNIDWEECLAAWRIVQATIFEHLYREAPFIDTINNFLPRRLRLSDRNWFYNLCLRGYGREESWNQSNWGRIELKDRAGWKLRRAWFIARYQIQMLPVSYHSGTYLRTMLSALYLQAYVATILILVGSIQYLILHCNYYASGLLFSMFLVVFLFVISKSARGKSRLRLLEDEILSIHACSVVWQAVIVAHFRALDELSKDSSKSMKLYSEEIGRQASDLVRNIDKIHDWSMRSL